MHGLQLERGGPRETRLSIRLTGPCTGTSDRDVWFGWAPFRAPGSGMREQIAERGDTTSDFGVTSSEQGGERRIAPRTAAHGDHFAQRDRDRRLRLTLKALLQRKQRALCRAPPATAQKGQREVDVLWVKSSKVTRQRRQLEDERAVDRKRKEPIRSRCSQNNTQTELSVVPCVLLASQVLCLRASNARTRSPVVVRHRFQGPDRVPLALPEVLFDGRRAPAIPGTIRRHCARFHGSLERPRHAQSSARGGQ